MELQDQLNSAIRICRTGREGLSVAQAKFTSTSLGIVANIRKKQSLKGVLRSLNTIKTLVSSYITLCSGCHNRFTCVTIQMYLNNMYKHY